METKRGISTICGLTQNISTTSTIQTINSYILLGSIRLDTATVEYKSSVTKSECEIKIIHQKKKIMLTKTIAFSLYI